MTEIDSDDEYREESLPIKRYIGYLIKPSLINTVEKFGPIEFLCIQFYFI